MKGYLICDSYITNWVPFLLWIFFYVMLRFFMRFCGFMYRR